MTYRQQKCQPYISMSDGFTSYTSNSMANQPLFCLGILCVPFELWPISRNESSCETILLLALLRSVGSFHNCYPIVLNGGCRRCRCLCWCCALHHCSAWTMPCNVPYLMASVAFLSISPIGAATCMLLIVQTATIALTATNTELPGLPSLLWNLLRTLRLQLWEQGCHLRIVFLL